MEGMMGMKTMTENLTWQQIHELIRDMRNKLETQKTVTRTINRINYTETLQVLRNQTEFQHNKNIKLKIIAQKGTLTIQMEKDQ